MRQPGADDHQRRTRLRQLVTGRAERRDVVRAQVLHLVDEDRDARADVRGQPGDLGEQLGEVDLDVAGVGPAAARGHVDPGLPAFPQLGAVRGGALRERLEDAEHLVDPLGVVVPDGEVPDRPVQGCGQRAAQLGVRSGLDLACTPAGADRHRAQLAEQDGLPDAAQAGEHEAALGPAPRHPLEDDLERVHLAVPPGQLRRPLTSAGGERVAHRIHASDGIGESRRNRRSGYRGRWACRGSSDRSAFTPHGVSPAEPWRPISITWGRRRRPAGVEIGLGTYLDRDPAGDLEHGIDEVEVSWMTPTEDCARRVPTPRPRWTPTPS